MRFPLWFILVAACAVLYGVFVISDRVEATHAAQQHAAFLADLQAGKLNTPEAFEARCGQPRWNKQTKSGPELHYLEGASDYYVTFDNGTPELSSEQLRFVSGKPQSWRLRTDDSLFFTALHCK